jgi:uncharacterized membrane protein YGL010W
LEQGPLGDHPAYRAETLHRRATELIDAGGICLYLYSVLSIILAAMIWIDFKPYYQIKRDMGYISWVFALAGLLGPVEFWLLATASGNWFLQGLGVFVCISSVFVFVGNYER